MSFNNNGKVSDFLERLQAQVPRKRETSLINQRQIQKVFCNFKGNFGQVLSIN